MSKSKSVIRNILLTLTFSIVLYGCGGGGEENGTTTNSNNTAPVSTYTPPELVPTEQYTPTESYPLANITGYGIDPTIDYPVSAGNTYYLDVNSGDDLNGDGSSANPWQTLSQAISIMQSGDTFILRTGNYGNFSESNAATRTDWITFKAEAGHNPVIGNVGLTNSSIRDTYLRFDGIQFSVSGGGAGVALNNVRNVEIRNSSVNNHNHKYETESVSTIRSSENILIYNNDLSRARRGIMAINSSNVTISRNKIYNLGGTSALHYAGGNTNFIIEKNNVFDSNFDTNDVDPDSPYIAGNTSSYPHSSGVAVRSNEVWIRGNIFHDIGSSSGIMFYIPDAAGGESAYSNIIIENNLFYDIHNGSVLRMYNAGTNIIVKNNTIVGHLRTDTTQGTYKLETALAVHSLATGYTGAGISVQNNIMLGRVAIPSAANTSNNIIWSFAYADSPHSFLSSAQDTGTKILTSSGSYYPISYLTNNFFAGIDAESDFAARHHQIRNFHLLAGSEAVSFADVNTQSNTSLGSLDANGFIRDDGPARDSTHHSVGAYEL